MLATKTATEQTCFNISVQAKILLRSQMNIHRTITLLDVDSQIHIWIVFSSPHNSEFPEQLLFIECKLENPLIDSHHDIIISRFQLPKIDAEFDESQEGQVLAPKVVNNRVKVLWSEKGIEDYKNIVEPHLSTVKG